jgi:hypothetical protein
VLVVDANVVVEVTLERFGAQALDTLGDEQRVAPWLLWSDVPAALSAMIFRAEVSRELGEAALARLDTINVEPRHPKGLIAEAWRIAPRSADGPRHTTRSISPSPNSWTVAWSHSTDRCGEPPGSSDTSSHPRNSKPIPRSPLLHMMNRSQATARPSLRPATGRQQTEDARHHTSPTKSEPANRRETLGCRPIAKAHSPSI